MVEVGWCGMQRWLAADAEAEYRSGSDTLWCLVRRRRLTRKGSSQREVERRSWSRRVLGRTSRSRRELGLKEQRLLEATRSEQKALSKQLAARSEQVTRLVGWECEKMRVESMCENESENE